MPEELPGPDGDNFSEPPPFFPYDAADAEREVADTGELVEVHIEGVFQAETGQQVSRFVLLSDGERKLPILIGPFEAQAILHVIENERPDRPMTHDLMRNVIEKLEGTLERVVIDDFWNTIYYAKLYIKHAGTELEIDSRPSDAICLALRFDSPVFVADSILNSAMDD
jgi:bifunctional DNase/RNase